ncbi:MAG TPA: polysaccharide biosynthesis C-terminal domain-containing protein, partial [Pyrinomonadaceae bacterium]|nr:polysaccharide biosynthesis C-terminal domain-containing protein [Pyrinomonadaceae bacterium]
MLIAAWLPPVSLGYYVVAVSAAGLSQILAGAVRTVAMPNIASRASSHARRELLGTIFRRYWLISVALMIAMSATIPILIPLIYGAGFRASVLPAEILIVAAMFTGAKSVLGEGAVALGDPWLISKANIIAVPVTLVLLAVLLPVWGLLGAATASATAYLVELATVIYLLRRRHSIAPSSLFTLDVSNMGEMLRLGARTSLGESASK